MNSKICLQLSSFISLLPVSRILDSNGLLSFWTLLFLSIRVGSVSADVIVLKTLWVSVDGTAMLSIRKKLHPQNFFFLNR